MTTLQIYNIKDKAQTSKNPKNENHQNGRRHRAVICDISYFLLQHIQWRKLQ